MIIPKEIKRKFLFTDFDFRMLVTAAECTHLMQGYTEESIRLMRREHQEGTFDYKICHKTGEGMTRSEAQCAINEVVFTSLWPHTVGRRVYKTRYFFPIPDYTGHRLELDVYDHSRIWPLVTAELEFESEDQAACFDTIKLKFICDDYREVTGSLTYLNIKLAC